MKKILFVSSEYYPQPSPNGICVEKIMNRCQKRGYEVVCLCATNCKKLPRHEVIKGTHVYRVSRSFYNRILYNWRSWPKWYGFPLFVLSKIYMWIKKCLVFWCWPLDDFVLRKHLYKKICVLNKHYGFDCIVVTHNPISAMAAVHDFATNVKSVRCIYYYIDALSSGNLVRINQERFAHLPVKNLFFKLAKKWEMYFAQNAEKIVVTEATRSHYMNNFANSGILKKTVFLNIPLLEELPKCQLQYNYLTDDLFHDGKRTVLFCGSLYSLRDPSYILKIIERLDKSDVQWVFIGNYDVKSRRKLLLAQHKFPDRIKVYGVVSHDVLVPCLNGADYYLNIGERLASVVSGKVFEYISWGKPIISTFPIPDNSSIPVLKKYPNALLLNECDEICDETLERVGMFLDESYGKRVEFTDMKNLLYSSTPDAFVDVIDGALRN